MLRHNRIRENLNHRLFVHHSITSKVNDACLSTFLASKVQTTGINTKRHRLVGEGLQPYSVCDTCVCFLDIAFASLLQPWYGDPTSSLLTSIWHTKAYNYRYICVFENTIERRCQKKKQYNTIEKEIRLSDLPQEAWSCAKGVEEWERDRANSQWR